MRIISLLAGANELLAELGLQSAICGTAHGAPGATGGVPIVARLVDEHTVDGHTPNGQTAGEPPLVETRAHEHVTRFVVDREAVGTLRPDVLITEEVCSVCLAAYEPLAAGVGVAQTTIEGQAVRLVSLHPRRLEDVLGPIVPLATLLQHPDRGHSLLKVRSSRLLALSMHVARYLVRHGGERPRVLLATVDGDWPRPDSSPPELRLPGRWMPDMIDAAGGLPLLAEAGDDDRASTPEVLRRAQPDVLIVGASSLATAVAATTQLAAAAEWQDVPAVRDGRAWALRFDELLTQPSPRLVDGVEVLLRIISPHVLGANGTPPAPERAVPVPSPPPMAQSS